MKPDRKIAVSQSSKSGLPPGTLIHVGDRDPAPTQIRCFEYNQHSTDEKRPADLTVCSGEADRCAWIKVSGLSDLEQIKKIGELLSLHPLTLEDILNTNQRPKYEEFDDYLYLVLKIIRIETTPEEGTENGDRRSGTGDTGTKPETTQESEDKYTISAAQLSIVLTDRIVCSFEEANSDIFNGIITRLFDEKSRIRKLGSDYLMYALADCVVDNYFVVFERIGEDIEELEERIIDGADPDVMEEIYTLKRNLLDIRKRVWPLRETIAGLLRNKPEFISEQTEVFLNDVSDHLYQLNDILESYREMSTGLYEIYLSTLSNRMNEVMKVLTIIATIFIPLTFIAGIYGMNFASMPELQWEFGYPAAILAMLVTAGIMVLYFRKKQWI
ncbi:magnesium/cobalt transporter CorA [Methanogenium sp. S4BF]|uniref:magnesium/cobalt transporter CorA n=1 Tax=Methanogenium sp. S4BF TaxID=1789226 RepID=UPI002416B1C5|nr:magnesium/cobalt transporter CorA [Methanogenium sp. S4BF]WFN33943.1 magnesium/cobalt transporter CorA [Methanogenium sp. S4BF]